MKAKSKEMVDNVKILFRSGKTWVLLTSLTGIILGLFMILKVDSFLNVICKIVGTALILFGVVAVAMAFRKEEGYHRVGAMIPGVLFLALGMGFFFRQEQMIALLWYFIGLAILVDAVYKLEHAFAMKMTAVPFWWSSLVDAVLTLVLAVIIMIQPAAANEAMVLLCGWILLANGLFDMAEFVLILAGKQMAGAALVAVEDAEKKETGSGENKPMLTDGSSDK